MLISLLLSRPGQSASHSTKWYFCCQALFKHAIHVTTSNLPGAEFEGEVFLTFTGWFGTSDEFQLTGTDGLKGKFDKGTTEVFHVMAPDVGNISSVTLRVTPTDTDPSWHLDHLDIINASSGYSGSFYHSNWLNKDTPSVCMYVNTPTVEYKVTAMTGQEDAGSWDGDVYLTLAGLNGTTDETLLVSDTRGFKVFTGGSSEVFSIKGADVGALTAATLRLVPTGTARQWQLTRLDVEQSGASANAAAAAAPVVAMFNNTGKIQCDGDNSTSITLTKHLPTLSYKVTVYTGDMDDGAFDGTVFIKVQGLNGSTEQVQLTSADKISAEGA